MNNLNQAPFKNWQLLDKQIVIDALKQLDMATELVAMANNVLKELHAISKDGIDTNLSNLSVEIDAIKMRSIVALRKAGSL